MPFLFLLKCLSEAILLHFRLVYNKFPLVFDIDIVVELKTVPENSYWHK